MGGQRGETAGAAGRVDNRWIRTRTETQQLDCCGGLQGGISGGGRRRRRGRLTAARDVGCDEPSVMLLHAVARVAANSA